MRTRVNVLLVVLALVGVSCGSSTPERAATNAAEAEATEEVESTTTSSIADTTTSTSTTSSSTTSAVPAEAETETEDVAPDESTTTSTSSTTTTQAQSPTTASVPASSSTTASTTTATTTSAAADPDGPVFEAQVFEISGPIVNQITTSWREGCPVGLDELRLISLNHWNNSGTVSGGQLIIHEDYADEIVQVFSRLFDAQFPIERMQLVDNFGGDDDLSMAANNTSAFNCREIAARPGTWSNHAFGAAIDINPLVNPLVSGSGVFPPGGAAFTDRSVEVQGGIYPGDVVTQAFAEIGWGWGGDWVNSKDWQHFSETGR